MKRIAYGIVLAVLLLVTWCSALGIMVAEARSTDLTNPSTTLISNLSNLNLTSSENIKNDDLIPTQPEPRTIEDHTAVRLGSIQNKGNGTSFFEKHKLASKMNSVYAAKTIIVPDNYASIQAAVDAASTGDTILVREGTYIENVKVVKTLTIRSEKGAQKTIVQAANPNIHVFEIEGIRNVTVSGFAIKGANGTFAAGISVDEHFVGEGGHCRIDNNILSNNYLAIECVFAGSNTIANNLIIGSGNNFQANNYIDITSDRNNILNNGLTDTHIRVMSGSYNLISRNVISGKAWYGIQVLYSSNNTISDNKISRNRPGAGLDIGPGSGNLISNNVFEGCGLEVSSTNNVVTNCTVNGKALVYLENESGLDLSEMGAGQIILVNCENMVVRNSHLSNTTIGIELYETSDSTIENNTFQNNGEGVLLRGGHDNVITGNTFHSNSHGVSIGGISSNNNINHNSIHDGSGAGIYLWSDDALNNIAQNNDVSGNYYGFYLASCSLNTILDNSICANSIGIYTSYSTIINGVPVKTENNRILQNNISGSVLYGILLSYSRNNHIYLNDFDNAKNAKSSSSSDIWNSPEQMTYIYGGHSFTNYLGNHWNDYTGVDLFSGPYQNETGSDGIGDTPYVIDLNNQDRYPLMIQNGKKNTILVFSFTPNPAIVGETVTLLGKLGESQGIPLSNAKIDVYVNGRFNGNLFTNSSGWFKASAKVDTSGTYNVKVAYNGSTTYNPSDYTQTLTVGVAIIKVWTDKTVYHVGDTMKVYIRVKNGVSALPVRVAIVLKLPNGNLYTVLNTTTTLPANYDSGNILWNTFTIPKTSLGTYTWIAELRNLTTRTLISQSTWGWSLTTTAIETLKVFFSTPECTPEPTYAKYTVMHSGSRG